MNKGDKTLCACGHEAICDGLGTGYATKPDGSTLCYACCALEDAKELRETGKLIGYLNFSIEAIPDNRGKHKPLGTCYDRGNKGAFTNWPGSFSIPVHSVKRSLNNFRAERLDFWFMWEDKRYWGISVGDNQIAHVRRVKS